MYLDLSSLQICSRMCMPRLKTTVRQRVMYSSPVDDVFHCYFRIIQVAVIVALFHSLRYIVIVLMTMYSAGWEGQTMASSGSSSISWWIWEPEAPPSSVARSEGWWTLKGGRNSWLCLCPHERVYWWKSNLQGCSSDGKNCSEDIIFGSLILFLFLSLEMVSLTSF